MTSRKLPVLSDYGSPTPSRLLRSTLVDLFGGQGKSVGGVSRLLPGYHLVYFPPPTNLSSLLPDNTDPLHSPGPPFTRRMWAGGDLTFDGTLALRLGNMVCREFITDVHIKGAEGEEKVFVTIKRDIDVKAQKGYIIEYRRLVFMRDRPAAVDQLGSPKAQRDTLKPQHEADFSHIITPSPALLFRFSALTFNAHRIHLDQAYCRDVEGHRNLLVHGPLSLVLMLQFLHIQLTREAQGNHRKGDEITHVDYRCLAPLYAEEELKVCARRKDTYAWETWIEGPDGGLAVRGSVETAPPPGEVRRENSIASETPTSPSQGKGDTSSTSNAVSQEEKPLASVPKSVEEIPTTAEEGALSADEAQPPNSSSS